MELLYFYALAHQTSFDVRWLKKGTVSETLMKLGLARSIDSAFFKTFLAEFWLDLANGLWLIDLHPKGGKKNTLQNSNSLDRCLRLKKNKAQKPIPKFERRKSFKLKLHLFRSEPFFLFWLPRIEDYTSALTGFRGLPQCNFWEGNPPVWACLKNT